MNRPDKVWNKLSVAEKEVGGIPNSSEDIKQAHAACNRNVYTRSRRYEARWNVWRFVF
jgi:hypothetical protein